MPLTTDWQRWLEIFAVVTGLVYVVQSIRGRASGWIAGLMSTLAYLVLSAVARLQLQSALQGLYAALAVYGWWQWRHGTNAAGRLMIGRLAPRGHAVSLLALVVLSLAGWKLLLHTGSPQPVLEAITTAAGLVATVLAARQFIDNWLWWILTNVATAWLYQQAGLRPTAGLYLAYAVLAVAGFLVIGPAVVRLIAAVREPVLLAFSTASSEAAYPKTLEQLVRFGVSKRIGSFVLPLGYSFNLDGSMMYCTFATLFIAQAYGITLTGGQMATMLLLLMVTSKGMAGVPRASLVVIAATLVHFHIPEAGLLLILGVDHFLDMGRSATNVIGNSVASAVVAKWEGELGEGADTPNAAGPAT